MRRVIEGGESLVRSDLVNIATKEPQVAVDLLTTATEQRKSKRGERVSAIE